MAAASASRLEADVRMLGEVDFGLFNKQMGISAAEIGVGVTLLLQVID